jgi:hypothetical protein
VIVTDPRIVAKTQQMKEVEEEISKSIYRQRTVDEILSGLRASGGLRKLSGISRTPLTSSRGVTSSVDAEAAVRALELLKSKSKEDHVAEVLAKARSRFLNKLDSASASASASANADSNSSDMTPLLRRNNSRDRMRVSPRTSGTGTGTGSDSYSGSSVASGGGALSASPTLRGVTPRGGTRDYRYHQTDTIREGEDDEENDPRDSRGTRDSRDRDRDRDRDMDSAQESDPLVSRSADFGRGLGIADRAGRRQR